MQDNTFLVINNLIYHIYTTEDFTNMKKSFLNMIKIIIPNTFSSILMADYSDSDSLLCNPLCYPESYTKMEELYLSIETEYQTRWLALCNHSALVRESELVSEEDFLNSSVYTKCYKPNNIYYSMQLHLSYNNTFLVVISLYRSKEQGDFNDEEMFIMKGFIDHLTYRFYQNYIEKNLPPNNSNNSKTNIPYLHTELALKYALTSRETEVLALILNNEDNEDIADKLCISSFTLKKHLQNIYRKFDVNSRWTLIQKCIHHEK